jgi:hypothetical protein
MSEILKILPIALYFIVGAISLVMAVKNLRASRFLPFQEEAAGRPWSELDDSVKTLILSLLRLAGLGFLTIAILMIVWPVANYFSPSSFNEIFIPAVALIFCGGLFVVNYSLFKKTGAHKGVRS